MTETSYALIVGAGQGLSASLARKAAAEGMTPILAARDIEKLNGLVNEVGGVAYACDVTDATSVAKLFNYVAASCGVPDLVVFNPSKRVRGASSGDTKSRL